VINSSLQFLRDVLNQFLRNRFGLEENNALLNVLIETNGSVPEINHNKIVISLINIEQETVKAFNIRNQKLPGGNYADINPYERYNLHLLISSNFDDYNETLRFLGAVIAFFQSHYLMERSSFSNMPVGVNRLEFEIEKINYIQMQGLWTSMGAKYTPSVIYKMRLLTIQTEEVIAVNTAISQISNQVAV